MTARPEPAPARLRVFEWSAFTGVIAREFLLYKRYWVSTSFAAIIEPTVMLLAFGFGFGALVSHVAGYDYLNFVGTGVVAVATLFSSVFSGMFDTFVRRTYQHVYDAILAAPVDVHELVTAAGVWIAIKSGAYGSVPVLVAMAFGLPPSWGMLIVPLITLVTGFGFACFGIATSAVAKSFDHFNYVISGVVTPLFLIAGTFFPVAALPGWATVAAKVNPLWHCVQLVRDAVFAHPHPLADLGHVAALLIFAALMWAAAVYRMRRKLID
jgi:lipooligosaccharide transport system permease protein